ncbi:MAG: hypothetical protein Q9207_006701 [Kuettlingeria erythrocarpa]
MLKLDCLPGQSVGLFCTCSEGKDEFTDTTPEGKAFLDFLYLMAKEPEYDHTMWGRVRESEDCILIFLGWDGSPPVQYRSSESFDQLIESSPLAAVRTVLQRPIKATNITFSPELYDAITDRPQFSHQLLTWEIPSTLDPTYHQNTAVRFDDLGDFISRKKIPAILSRRFRHNDLAGVHRGWASRIQAETPAALEPSEKTHVFLFSWRSTEAEAKVKDGRDEHPRQEWWPEKFTAIENEWKAMGMKIESLHLSLWDFMYQLNWHEDELKRAERDRVSALTRGNGAECLARDSSNIASIASENSRLDIPQPER